jgi:hypothetical protein
MEGKCSGGRDFHARRLPCRAVDDPATTERAAPHGRISQLHFPIRVPKIVSWHGAILSWFPPSQLLFNFNWIASPGGVHMLSSLGVSRVKEGWQFMHISAHMSRPSDAGHLRGVLRRFGYSQRCVCICIRGRAQGPRAGIYGGGCETSERMAGGCP